EKVLNGAGGSVRTDIQRVQFVDRDIWQRIEPRELNIRHAETIEIAAEGRAEFILQGRAEVMKLRRREQIVVIRRVDPEGRNLRRGIDPARLIQDPAATNLVFRS